MVIEILPGKVKLVTCRDELPDVRCAWREEMHLHMIFVATKKDLLVCDKEAARNYLVFDHLSPAERVRAIQEVDRIPLDLLPEQSEMKKQRIA